MVNICKASVTTYLYFHHITAERCLYTPLKNCLHPGAIKSGLCAEYSNVAVEAEARVVGYKLFSQNLTRYLCQYLFQVKTNVTCVFRQSMAAWINQFTVPTS